MFDITFLRHSLRCCNIFTLLFSYKTIYLIPTMRRLRRHFVTAHNSYIKWHPYRSFVFLRRNYDKLVIVGFSCHRVYTAENVLLVYVLQISNYHIQSSQFTITVINYYMSYAPSKKLCPLRHGLRRETNGTIGQFLRAPDNLFYFELHIWERNYSETFFACTEENAVK